MTRTEKAKLELELVPRSCWWSNVRSQVTKAEWEICKKFVAERSGRKCEICGGKGKKWPVECHEIWDYDSATATQTLVGLIALCPNCHHAKHIGRSSAVMTGREKLVLYNHICQVNGWTPSHLIHTVMPEAFAVWSIMSEVNWALDVSYLKELGIELPQYHWGHEDREPMAEERS